MASSFTHSSVSFDVNMADPKAPSLNAKILKPLDEALRCHICFDYFTNCMITKCSHNYCSLCIRRYMTYKSQCPTCFQVATEPELQNNRLIDEILRIYKNIRETLKIPPDSIEKQYSEQPSSSRADKKDREPSKCDSPTYVAANEQTSCKTDEVTISNEVSCPVCYITVPSDRINTHLDNCLKQPEERNERKFLPKLVYHLLSDKQIRKKLKEHGLSTSGDRQTLIKRHKNFLILYNANCDSLNPKPVSDLLLEIERHELEERLNAPQRNIQINKKSEPTVIEREHESYVREHQSQFNALINDVQQRDLGRAPVKKEYVAVEDVTSSPIVDASGNVVGESSLRVGSPTLDLVTVKTEVPDTQMEPNDKLDKTENVSGKSVLSKDKKLASDPPPITMELSFRVKKGVHSGVKMKEESPSLLDVISNQDVSIDSSPSSLDDFEISKRQAHLIHKKNARRRRSSDGKDSQRKK